MEICKVQFEELIKEFPNTTQSSEATILKEIDELKTKLNLILQKLKDGATTTKLSSNTLVQAFDTICSPLIYDHIFYIV
ncbi:hypothetical protein P691DRAFT_590221 [Macrolepiota fuliginosa MF-IS2]|uniref:Uncharacterized protein n=1 Tax=Macrolepiota fuliginosa MF-IS2 TaxID=1400762 RepID=A0A9P5XDG0_9AGAR|nr:hypothetical protein P691DRAFT_590221 [Macrolepiota fuliginosa MF-IS2]